MKNQNTRSYKIYLLLKQKEAYMQELTVLLDEQDPCKILKAVCSSLKEVNEEDNIYFDNLIQTVILILDKIPSFNIGCCLDALKKIQGKINHIEKARNTVSDLNDLFLQKLSYSYQNNQYKFLMSMIDDIHSTAFLRQVLNTYPHYVNARNEENKHIALILLDKVLYMLENDQFGKELLFYHQVILEFFKRNYLHISKTEIENYSSLITNQIEKLKKGPHYHRKLSYYLTYVNCLLNKQVTEDNINSIMERYGISSNFDIAIQRELDMISKKDYIITIDDKDTLDMDDALSIKRLDDHYHLTIYIADVSKMVKMGSLIDKEAHHRVETIYLSDTIIPMLPVELSNIIISLNSGSYKHVWKFEVDIYDNREITSFSISKDYIMVDRKLSYQEADNILSGKKKEDITYETLVNLSDMAFVLRSQGSDKTFHRTMEEAINYHHWIENKKNAYKNITKAEIIIEESMILLNYLLADYFSKKGYPMIYRVHEQPSTTAEYNRLMRLKSLIESEYTTKENYVKIINSLMSMYSKAYYSTSNLGHFGLGLNSYCHGTSPIRRYPDLVVQRLLNDYVIGVPNKEKDDFWKKYIEGLCAHCNEEMEHHQSFQEEYEITKTFLKTFFKK